MRALTYYVAATIDGYIAGPDGQFDFFGQAEDLVTEMIASYPETVPGHLRSSVGLTDTPNRRFDTVIMGRGTYEPALHMGITSPYPHLEQYAVSSTLSITDPAINLVTDDPAALVRRLKAQEGKGIWLCGGGKLAASLMDEIDEIIIKRNPIVAGSGTPLSDGPFQPTTFAPHSTRDLPSGVNITTYTRR